MTQTPDTTQLPSPYQVSSGHPGVDRDNVLRVWRECGIALEADQAAARYDWFYSQNPLGNAQINFLTTTNPEERIGFLGVGLRALCIAGKMISAGVLVDFVVDSRHRIALPALMLQRYGHKRALESMAVLYGIPDTKAVAIMKRLGSHVCLDLPCYVRVLRTRPYLQRYMPSWCAIPLAWCLDSVDRAFTWTRMLSSSRVGEWRDTFDTSFDRLWATVPKQGLCIGGRNCDFLRWRFGGQLSRRFRVFVVRAPNSAEIHGYFVCEQTQDVMFVKDCLHVGSATQLRESLLLLCAAARRAGAVSVNLQVTPVGDFPRALHATFFKQRSKRMFVAIANESVREQCVAAQWYVTPADEDV
jgi:hypothetical protein